MEYKMVLCVRNDIPMSVGKKCSQCAHAAVGCFQKAMEVSPECIIEWESQGAKKVVVKIESVKEFEMMKQTCEELGVLYYEVVDAGKTEISPGTITVLGVGPGPTVLIDVVTGDKQLL
ncbi:peptidyl-tRNA hydrolase 2, mitochondrial precursor, putative [Entamoeba dispar SAW760]|uniref:peptidyl-tRNA hydrolase n=1 Tax=Entamoeba dispar (strain ATCC PRA-260 / SAW760) TaxID=370354 RepID=B0EVD0_ENTDS|nr:peptidyl-tRNA hydrolase 2, mitochondrial precursor, putative [Entamoeba dispar SAW760]EDR21542.1 peptidyl-tRNA hydrolase 2, mitochondrial precursor, putative [Entamoeba dispar SAW760]|eukprot:EDR21542.1 peptidyl-tRNA hydrolase 2, mitochondrial precursor, putative [Entamoeba dispar SAW760]